MKSVAVLALTVVLAASCAHAARSRPLTLGPADSGKSVQLAVGQAVTVRLAWDPSTGYRWQTVTEPDAQVLIIVDSGYDRPQSNKPGTPGQAWWKLRATGAGSTSIAFRYVQPWEPAKDAQQFTLTVTIK